MPAQVLFNQLAYVDRLTRGGFTSEQARASAEALETAFSEGVATRSDVESSKRELQSSIDALRHETAANIDALRHETAASIESLRRETAASIDGVKHDVAEVKRDVAEAESRLRLEFKRDLTDIRLEIAQSKNETLRWLFGFVIVLIGAIFTIVKFVR
ncbi:CCDC90 family protein [Methylosinus sp. Sm6]|uniref:CCDC90 family protein n=1 Tax=Methylosinus sp. Sm6 TaxID=2866948 RepID=UPI001C998D3E|nr:CCDC90 family protein [Methylosinus sp. Sm6]MBY6242409.1 CCDC90 family protein [Methylosinus sp. Sm6]